MIFACAACEAYGGTYASLRHSSLSTTEAMMFLAGVMHRSRHQVPSLNRNFHWK